MIHSRVLILVTQQDTCQSSARKQIKKKKLSLRSGQSRCHCIM
ncbi:uncharacterized protein PgNI_06897 [Pyricularia grisea]|uniref:Uncharacterized protein n=1 Tax=Pyricularia grisea TaxID=148305 RepID=A0A6P8B1W4_PYRGI|nr:uncharacterized protein PgNI_06897 [Pyricularia grisea]TLD08841.1 hypothetical protein PgNI_06897 [Pyricularia grisea]